MERGAQGIQILVQNSLGDNEGCDFGTQKQFGRGWSVAFDFERVASICWVLFRWFRLHASFVILFSHSTRSKIIPGLFGKHDSGRGEGAFRPVCIYFYAFGVATVLRHYRAINVMP